jgi:UDP-N-acetylglucosamine--N-acetylmuramyl-(pentapeptide) pyrophosphoryl-undecaprenol N-acetylglucosamine transferase
MKIVLTGGGTAGHVTPNIALVPKLRELGYEIVYIGTADGMERQLIEREGLPYYPIHAGKLRRYLDLKNLTDTGRIARGFLEAVALLGKLKPAVVFSKGGFVSCPVVWAAWLHRVPVIIHESDLTPGLANRLSLPFARTVCYTFPETARYIRSDAKTLTGIPVRATLFRGNAAVGRSLCGFGSDRPVLAIIGGSQGSGVLNTTIRGTLPELLQEFQVCHICGPGNIDPALNARSGYQQFEYVNEELPHLFAMADLVVSRAGATTIFELLALKKPNLLIPLSKQSSRGDQILNARSFEKQGFSKVLMEEELTTASFLTALKQLYREREAYRARMAQSKLAGGIDAIVTLIQQNSRR